MDSDHTPIVGARIELSRQNNNDIVRSAVSGNDGRFILSDINAGTYVFTCEYDDYPEYVAEVTVKANQDLLMGSIIAFIRNGLDEVIVVGNRNVFTTQKQSIYPSSQQLATSSGGLDLIKKLPIPFIDINLTTRTISSLDPLGGVAVFLNGIPTDADELATISPDRILRIDVIKNPGIVYGDNLSTAIDVILKKNFDGVALNVNTTNSAKLISGINSITASYIRDRSEFVISQSERYNSNSHLSSTSIKRYLMPDNQYHSIISESTSMKENSFTHNTTLTYNFIDGNKTLFQAKGYINLYNKPRNNWSYTTKESDIEDFVITEKSRDKSNSLALNIYFKQRVSDNQSLMFNVVGTNITTDYFHKNNYQNNIFESELSIHGVKKSVIGEARHVLDFSWGTISSGIRTFISNTKNHYRTDSEQHIGMSNVNSSLYAQFSGSIGRFSGDLSLSLNRQYYKQENTSYDKYIFAPDINIYYRLSHLFSVGYSFSLSPRLPTLSTLNDIIFQNDQWERSVGNPNLKPFNHIENSISAAYYKSNLYAAISCTYALNKDAIMPTITRTEMEDGSVVFDNGVANQNNMKQWAVSAYLRYGLPNNKLIFSINGLYNWFDAIAKDYSNRKGFVYINASIESYLGKFYLSANICSRYNSLFAETIWFNEYTSALSANYNWRSFQIGVKWEQPFQNNGTNSRVETRNAVIHKLSILRNRGVANNVVISFVWNWNKGLKSKSKGVELNNQDLDSGILK